MASILKLLEPLLVKHVPEAVAAMKINEPVYSLRLYYDGTDTPEEVFCSRFLLVKEAWRKKTMSKHGIDAPFYMWSRGEIEGWEDGFGGDMSAFPEIVSLCKKWYAKLEDSGDSAELVEKSRRKLHKVSAQLNSVDWTKLCPATDDFVVFPANGSETGEDFEDMEASVPPSKVEVLRQRKFLGPDADSWDRVGN